ncbi:unnamed protein product [Moneuplotes crassus]|uniref:Uncharacterized protein n=1 Tax=Euplotes crassus TaxID=5936 RepID=A0AAD1UMZ3_EUPCR|nr:unnamed protein product [Moneuplotes crassus]
MLKHYCLGETKANDIGYHCATDDQAIEQKQGGTILLPDPHSSQIIYCNRLCFFQYHVYSQRIYGLLNYKRIFIVHSLNRELDIKNGPSFKLSKWKVICFKHISTELLLLKPNSLSE